MAARGSPGADHSGAATGSQTSSRPSPTRIPTSAEVIDFAIDHEGCGSSGSHPLYSSTTSRPPCTTRAASIVPAPSGSSPNAWSTRPCTSASSTPSGRSPFSHSSVGQATPSGCSGYSTSANVRPAASTAAKRSAGTSNSAGVGATVVVARCVRDPDPDSDPDSAEHPMTSTRTATTVHFLIPIPQR